MADLCGWHEGGRVRATHSNTWTDPQGVTRRNFLCDEHQQEFLTAFQAVERGSSSVSPTPRRRKSRPQPRSAPSDTALARAWARSVGEPVNERGNLSYTIERKWIKAGRPNVLGDL